MITRLSTVLLLALVTISAGCGQGTTQQGTLYSISINQSLSCYISEDLAAIHQAAVTSVTDAGYTIVAYHPFNTFLVRPGSGQRPAALSSIEGVRWTGNLAKIVLILVCASFNLRLLRLRRRISFLVIIKRLSLIW